MVDPIQGPAAPTPRVNNVDPLQMRRYQPASAPSASFKDVLADAVGEVQRLQEEADTTIKELVAGEIKDVADAMVAVEKADVAFKTMMVVRNKIIAAYEEVTRMQV
jgi:flagellar hook-basal body complex protein FliE